MGTLNERQFGRSALRRAQEIGAVLPPVRTRDNGQLVSNAAEHRRVLRAYMKSEIPAAHLHGLTAIHTDDIPDAPDSANYTSPEKIIRTGWNLRDGGDRVSQAEDQHALLHELGHHRTTRIQSWASDAQQEAMADNYAVKFRSAQFKDIAGSTPYEDTAEAAPRKKWSREYRATRRSGEVAGESDF